MTDAIIFLSDPVYWNGTALVLGLLVGSFLNVVIHRLPIMMEREFKQECQLALSGEQDQEPAPQERYNLIVPASTCPKCQHKIKPWENIPVISYLFLRGKCSGCQTPISARYPIIELVSGLLALMCAVIYGPGMTSFMVIVLCWLLLSMSMIDIDHQLLPDSLTLPLLWLGLLANTTGMFTTLEEAVYGAVAGYLTLWSVYWLFKLVTGKEGMGYGDFKLLAALGAWMGWQYLPLIILLSSFVGAFVGIAMIVIRGRDRNIPIPFGPYLAAAGLIAMFWGDAILKTYLGSF
ncbi:prepilin peptidase [Parendozoicomonas haliclonae]|uniref:Prepilin leader peptidase/N-methyltransferase n=1 Tax=Parendozoicomonas haliclonae TaxID=1960125 RepID=A0A1X7AF96_9GAMM|nr:A24 family peptidase [Parendozoicomonas haliclonae]SMA35015.1 Type 4 prepilin-like protein leader peptide-processing enzyme [Parendozoicomonas haliclonae]